MSSAAIFFVNENRGFAYSRIRFALMGGCAE